MASDSRERFFDLFGLPRELRDQIYDEVLDGEPDVDLAKTNGMFTTVKHAMTSRLALVSHQFSEECKGRALQKTLLVLKDNWRWAEGNDQLEAPHVTSLIQKIKLILAVRTNGNTHDKHDEPCEHFEELDFHQQTIAKLLVQLPRVNSVSIELYLQYDLSGENEVEAFLHHHAILTSIERMDRIDVYRFSDLRDRSDELDEHMMDFGQPGRLVLTWSAGDSEVKRVGDASSKAGSAMFQTA